MRNQFENLKDSSLLTGRFAYRLLKLLSSILPASRRVAIVTRIKRLLHYRPAYCRRVTTRGVTMDARSPRVIVSLTSYPARIKTIHRVVAALLHQTFKPDMVVLWLGEDKFPRKEAELPGRLLRLRKYGLTIGWCKDLRSYTKLIPSLRAFPDDIIVTADDDTFYGPKWLDKLYASYLQAPNCVHSNRVLRVPELIDGQLPPYQTWKFNTCAGNCSLSNFLLGFSGVLYPPHVLDEEVLNVEQFQKLAPCADDIWFWAMAVKCGTSICVVSDPVLPQCDIYASQENALANVNVAGEALNDKQLSDVISFYGLRNRIHE